MGLDWNPANKPLPGHEAEADTLHAALLARPSVEAVSERWNLLAVGLAAAGTAVAWALGWFVNPLRTGFMLCALLFTVGWPIYSRAQGIRLRAAVVFLTVGIWHAIGAYGLPVLALVRGGWPFSRALPTEATASVWLGWTMHNALALVIAGLAGAGVWAYGWRYFDPRRIRHGISPDALRERFFAHTVAAYTTVGAPVVGRDAVADAFILARLRAPGRDGVVPSEEEAQARFKKFQGYRVLDLAPPSDGLPVYTNAPVNPHLERVAFRGKFLEDCVDVIGPELLERARERMEPAALVAYGEALLAKGRAYAAEHGVPEVADRRESPDDLESPAGRAHVVISAGKWCVYWGARGHGLDPWF